MVAAVDALPEEWRLQIPAQKAAEAALSALPDATERAALHSNPAPEHVFVDPETRQLTGLIDFGDAYIGHPAFDLRPYRDPTDRTALLEGYCSEGVVGKDFLNTWRVSLILGELAGALRRRQPPAQADDSLRRLLAEIT